MNRPDVTKAQIIASAAAGVPIIVSLLAAFGVWHPSHVETEALRSATGWAAGFGALLVLGDAHLRGKRNEADAVRAAGRPARAAMHLDGEAIAESVRQNCRSSPVMAEGGERSTSHLPGSQAVLPLPVGPPISNLPSSVRPDDGEVDLADPMLDEPDVNAADGHSLVELPHEAHGPVATPEDLADRERRLASRGASA